MSFEKFKEISSKEGEKFEEEEVEKELEERPKVEEEKIKEETEKEIPEVEKIEEEFKRAELEEIREKIEEIREKELEERKKQEVEEEAEKKLEIMREVKKETVPERFGDLIGDNSEEAWRKRRKLAEKDPMYVAASLAGVASERAREWLDKNKESQKMWWGITRGLIGDDSEKAWEIREHLKVDKRVNRIRGGRWSIMKKTLGFHKSELLFKMRGKIKFPGWYEPGDLVISTTGLDSEKAWELRKEFEDIAPAEVLISLAGDNSEKAWKIRKKYKEDKKLQWAYWKSLIGLEGQEK